MEKINKLLSLPWLVDGISVITLTDLSRALLLMNGQSTYMAIH